MSAITLLGAGPATMCSLEISELVESRHDKVKQSIERLADRGVFQLPPLGEVQNHLGQRVSVYQLDKRASLIAVAQLCPEFTAKIVDRWQELEARQAQPLSPSSFSRMQLIELAMQAEQERLESDAKRLLLEVEVSDLKPKAQALEILSAGEDAVTITQAAKLLGIKRDRLTTWLHVNCWVYRQNGCWVAYENQIRSGRLSFKEARFTEEKTGQERFAPYCHVTPKGLVLLAEKLARQLAATESP